MSRSATVVITTKDRREELAAAIRSALAQSAPVEVLVIDDGSTDGTSQMVRSEFPSVRLECSESSVGYIVQRNRAARMAKGEIIFSIDDDAEFSTPLVVEQTLKDFDDPRIGSVAIPYLEPNKDKQRRQQPPDNRGIWVTDTFIGTAHALKRDIFLKLRGYREQLFHQGEERDYCLRMLDAGYVTRLGRADLIRHMESPRRDFSRMDFYGRRNDVLFVCHNVPMVYFPVHLLGTTWNGIRSAVRARRLAAMFKGMVRGYVDGCRFWNERRPMPPAIYSLNRRLKKRGPVLLKAVESQLPPLPARDGPTSSCKNQH